MCDFVFCVCIILNCVFGTMSFVFVLPFVLLVCDFVFLCITLCFVLDLVLSVCV